VSATFFTRPSRPTDSSIAPSCGTPKRARNPSSRAPPANCATSMPLGTTSMRAFTPSACSRASMAAVGTTTASAAFAYDRVRCAATLRIARSSNGK
jgi:hypothetical protein